MVQQVCGACDGAGKVIRSPCMTCKGRGSNHTQVRESINIPKGVDNGVNLRVSKKGHCGVTGPPGDLIIHVKVRPHEYFRREGSNIYTDLHLSLAQAVLGSEVKIKTLYGDVQMRVPAGT